MAFDAILEGLRGVNNLEHLVAKGWYSAEASASLSQEELLQIADNVAEKLRSLTGRTFSKNGGKGNVNRYACANRGWPNSAPKGKRNTYSTKCGCPSKFSINVLTKELNLEGLAHVEDCQETRTHSSDEVRA